MINQYSGFRPSESTTLNVASAFYGDVADKTGLSQAFKAYRVWLGRNEGGVEQGLPGLEGFSGEQLFFIQYGRTMCRKERKEGRQMSGGSNRVPFEDR